MMNPDDNFSDGESSPASKEDSSSKGGESDSKTALLPIDICPDMKPGQDLTLKIVRVTDDQYEVEYSPKEKDQDSESGEGEEMAPAAASQPTDSNYE